MPQMANSSPRPAPCQCEQHALRQELTNQPTAPGAQRTPYGDFSLPVGGTRELQIGYVGARDQQYQAHGTEQDKKRRASVSNNLVMQADQTHAPPCVLGVLLFDAAGDRVHLRLRLLNRDTWLQPGDAAVYVISAVGFTEIQAGDQSSAFSQGAK